MRFVQLKHQIETEGIIDKVLRAFTSGKSISLDYYDVWEIDGRKKYLEINIDGHKYKITRNPNFIFEEIRNKLDPVFFKMAKKALERTLGRSVSEDEIDYDSFGNPYIELNSCIYMAKGAEEETVETVGFLHKSYKLEPPKIIEYCD